MANTSPIDNLLSTFQNQLERDWRKFRNIEGNDTSRGSSYESALSNILNKYFEGIYKIETNCSIMDMELKCFDEFRSSSQNEFDVVALFRQASPRVILKEGDVTWIPLSAVAFLCESKSKVDKGRLKSDLKKFQILRSIESDPDDRFPTKVHGDFNVDHQIHCLVYDKSEISNSTMTDLLEKYTDAWDIILVVETDTIILNSTVPYVDLLRNQAIGTQMDAISSDTDGDVVRKIANPTHNFMSVSNGFAWFMIVLSATIPVPLAIQTTELFTNLIKETKSGLQYGAKTSVDSDDTIIGPVDPDEDN